MSKHTPGPWWCDAHDEIGTVPMMLVKIGRVYPPSRNEEEFAANKRILTQAPTMFKALYDDSLTQYNLDLSNPMYAGKPPIKHRELLEYIAGCKWEEI